MLPEEHIAAGRLKRLDLKEHSGRVVSLPIHVVHERGRPPGRAGRWLVDDLRRRLPRGDGEPIPLPTQETPDIVSTTAPSRPRKNSIEEAFNRCPLCREAGEG